MTGDGLLVFQEVHDKFLDEAGFGSVVATRGGLCGEPSAHLGGALRQCRGDLDARMMELVVEGPSLRWRIFFLHCLVVIVHRLPPWEVPQRALGPLRLSDAT